MIADMVVVTLVVFLATIVAGGLLTVISAMLSADQMDARPPHPRFVRVVVPIEAMTARIPLSAVGVR